MANKLETIKDCGNYMASVIEDVRAGRTDPNLAAQIAQMLDVQSQLIMRTKMEADLEDLKKIAKELEAKSNDRIS